jgi:hypothetical protein
MRGNAGVLPTLSWTSSRTGRGCVGIGHGAGAVKERSRDVPQTSSLSGDLGKAARSAGRKGREGLAGCFID